MHGSGDPRYSIEAVKRCLTDRANWGRWGSEDQLGATNLITPTKVASATTLVRHGRTVSLARPIATKPGPGNPFPASHYLRSEEEHEGHPGGFVADYMGIDFHNPSTTHLDALCHTWGEGGGWNGVTPADNIRWDGVRRGGVEAWHAGIVTRGVLLDVPRHRGTPFVTPDRPVQGSELAEVCESQGVTAEPGDALLVYSGREEWDRRNPPWNGPEFNGPGARPRPGLHPSCLVFIRDTDCSFLLWDMTEAKPFSPAVPWGVHSAIFAFGVGLVDHALLEPLALECAALQSWEFLLVLAPLVLTGGTGCPLNPIAVL